MSRKASDLLFDRFTSSQDQTAIIWPDGNWTYRELYGAAMALSEDWRSRGVRPGDRIALMAGNGHYMVAAYVACMISGLTAVPVNHELSDRDQAFILALTRPKLEIRDFPAGLERENCDVSFEFNVISDDAFAIFFTSGTTGRPKGVRHSLEGMLGNVSAFNAAHGIDAASIMYHVLPMTYMAGFLNTLLSPLAAGGSVVLGPRFSPMTALRFWNFPLEKECNVVWLNPTISGLLCRSLRNQETAARVAGGFGQVFCGTAPLSEGTRIRFQNTFGVPLQESYGTSELLLISAQTRQEARDQANVGSPLSGLVLKSAPDAESGASEILVQSSDAMLGYLTEDGLVSTEDENGYIATGDSGEVIDGVLYISGRLKDLIVRGGNNVSPTAIENVVSAINGADEVAVIGVPHEIWGEAIMVCVTAPKCEDVAAFISLVKKTCREMLANAQQPDFIEVLEKFPKSETGKIKKNMLKELVLS